MSISGSKQKFTRARSPEWRHSRFQTAAYPRHGTPEGHGKKINDVGLVDLLHIVFHVRELKNVPCARVRELLFELVFFEFFRVGSTPALAIFPCPRIGDASLEDRNPTSSQK